MIPKAFPPHAVRGAAGKCKLNGVRHDCTSINPTANQLSHLTYKVHVEWKRRR